MALPPCQNHFNGDRGSGEVDGARPSVWAPLRNRVYRHFLSRQFGSSIGTLDAKCGGPMVFGREAQQ